MDSILIKNPDSNRNINENYNVNIKNITVYENSINELVKYNKLKNPSFYTKIIIQNNDLTEEDLKKIYNMCLIGGTIYFPEKYNKFFKNKRMIKKQKNYIYHLKDRIVDFIIVGTQRGGTTSLSLNISKHPDIYINKNKDPSESEIHFFDINWKKGINWYKKETKIEKNKNKVVGEKTPSLMYLDFTHPYIQSVNPFIKLIIILRNPVERAYSNWKLNKENDMEALSFSKAVAFELKNLKNQNKNFHTATKHYIGKGFYYKQIKNLLKWFPKDNILILISEKTKLNMNKEYNKVYNFLNIKELNNINYELEYVSKNKSKINPIVYQELLNLYKKDILSLEKLFGLKTDWI